MTRRTPSASPRRLVRSALALALGLTPLAGQAQIVRTTAVPFLQIEPDSRAAGMGMTGVATADNANAIFWNPAALAGQEGAEFTFTHAPWLPSLGADLFYEYASGKYAVDGVGTFAAHATFLNLGEQQYCDEFGNCPEELRFKSYDLAVGASYGTDITETLALGGGARLVYSNLAGGVTVGGQETRAGVAVGVDLGLLWKPSAFNMGSVPIEPRVGFNLANMGPSIQYSDNEQADPIPTNLRFGTALSARLDDYNRVTWAVDFNKLLVDKDSTGEAKPFYQAIFSSWGPVTVDLDGEGGDAPESVGLLRQLTFGTGLEYWYNDLFALRGGFFYEDPYNGNRKFVTVGTGFRYNIVGVDISYIVALEDQSPLAEQLRFSLLLNVLR